MSNLLPTRPLIEADMLAKALEGDDPPVIIDCRFRLDDPSAGVRAWRHERLPCARYGHLDRDFSGPVVAGISGRHPLPEPAVFNWRMRSWGVGPATPVVFYDDAGGAFAARGWWLACHAGHPAARILDGGIAAWTAAGGRLESGPPASPPIRLAPPWPPRAPLLEAVSAAGVEAVLGTDTPLVDARSEARFAGREEPIDPVAGHIPGARCLPHTGNLTADGRLRPAGELAGRWADIDADSAICYCGSGVTAAHNVLAAVVGGAGRPRLYPGSWSEWIRDPRRPVARDPS